MVIIKTKILLIMMILVTVFILVNSISYGKYVIDNNILAVELEIDRTKPVGTVSYSTTNLTKEYVLVTVNLSEPIEEIEDWSLSEDQLTMNKVYKQKTVELLTIVDLAGNENIVEINIK